MEGIPTPEGFVFVENLYLISLPIYVQKDGFGIKHSFLYIGNQIFELHVFHILTLVLLPELLVSGYAQHHFECSSVFSPSVRFSSNLCQTSSRTDVTGTSLSLCLCMNTDVRAHSWVCHRPL